MLVVYLAGCMTVTRNILDKVNDNSRDLGCEHIYTNSTTNIKLHKKRAELKEVQGGVIYYRQNYVI